MKKNPLKKIPLKKLARKLRRRKILIGIAIGLVVIAAMVTAAVIMDASTVKLVNSNPDAGSLLGGGRISSGSTITIRAQSNPGYVFTNWTNSDGTIASAEPVHKLSVPESNITLTANWMIVDWDLNLHIGSDDNTTTYPKTFTVKDEDIYLNAPTKTGYTFLGWYEDADFQTPAKDFIPSGTAKNLSLYAKWASSYLITYDLGDPRASNNPENPATYTEYNDVILESPVCYELNANGDLTGGNYTFLGWYDTDGNKISKIVASNKQDITLTARWDLSKPVYYTVYSRDNQQYVTFGRYPQHILDDKRTIAELNQKIENGTLSPNPVTGLYTYNNTLYIKTTATPYQNNMYFSDGQSINKDQVYYFIVEPITWRVLSGDPSDPKSDVLLLSEEVLTAHLFRSDLTVRSYQGATVYANNWEYSDIRNFLNNDFYNEAFMEGEASFIEHTLVDFSQKTAHYDRFANGKTTDDRVFLLSYADTANTDYGWNHWTIKEDPSKIAKATDYAKAMGVYASLNSGKEHDGAHWWLRSSGDFEERASVTAAIGTVGTYDVSCKAIGVRPAIKVKFNQTV